MLIGIFYSQVVESSSLVSVLFQEAISHPYIYFFHLLVNGFSVIREYGSTLYVGLARAISPTNSGVARGVLRGLEHPLSQKRKKIELVFSKKIKL